MSDEFRECVVLLLQRIGLGEPERAYVDDVVRLNEACDEWHRLHAARLGFLEFDLPDLLDGGLATGNLDQAHRLGLPRNEAARHFVRWIDERSGRRGTLLMLQIILTLQVMLTEAKNNAQGGES